MARKHDRAQSAEPFQHELRALPIGRIWEARHSGGVERINDVDDADIALGRRDEERGQEERRYEERRVAACRPSCLTCSALGLSGKDRPEVLIFVCEDECVETRLRARKELVAELFDGVDGVEIAVLCENLWVAGSFLECFDDEADVRFLNRIGRQGYDMSPPLCKCLNES